MENVYQPILDKIQDRIRLLREHNGPTEKVYENQYAELMDAVTRVVGVALQKELEDLYTFVSNLQQSAECK